jgi:hypothetical protein
VPHQVLNTLLSLAVEVAVQEQMVTEWVEEAQAVCYLERHLQAVLQLIQLLLVLEVAVQLVLLTPRSLWALVVWLLH